MSGEETNGEGGQECAHQDEAVLDGGSGVSGGGNGVGPVVGMLAQTVAGLKARSPLTSAAHKLPGKVCHASDGVSAPCVPMRSCCCPIYARTRWVLPTSGWQARCSRACR